MGSARRLGLALAGLALAAACGRPDGSRSLAEGFRPASAASDDGPGFWLEAAIADGAWRDVDGAWTAADPFAASDLPLADGVAPRIVCGGTAVEQDPAAAREGELVLAGADPPRGCRVSRFVSAGGESTSAQRGLGPRWRVAAGEIASDAIPLWPGEPQQVRLDESGARRLSFAVSCLAPEPATGEAVLCVLLGGAELARRPLSLATRARPERVALDLPVDLQPGAVLRFEVEGPPCLVVLHAPTISPLVVTATERPPDLILVVADTFRADNLAAYGSRERPAPALDALAERGLLFRRAWATSAWTLPSHASLLRGLYPYEHGAVRPSTLPADELVSIAERLSAAGYRTVAVTNANFVSREFGMDRGFEWFEERTSWDLAGTLSAALELLDAGDERPTFLFLHSYRTHWPYTVPAGSRDAAAVPALAAEALELQADLVDAWMRRGELAQDDPSITNRLLGGDWLALLRLLAEERTGKAGPEVEAEVAALADRLRLLYAGAVRDFDASFERLLAALEQRRFLERGLLVFTSDHGEAFAEHDVLFHGAGTWEELLRVPLFLVGAGIAPGVSEDTASLVDLPRTLAQAAGVSPDPRWSGRSLLDSGGSVPAYAVDCRTSGDPLVMLIDGADKAVLPLAGAGAPFARFEHRYDLGADPAERENAAGRDPASDAALYERHKKTLREILTPAGSPHARRLTKAEIRRFEAIGYGGLQED